MADLFRYIDTSDSHQEKGVDLYSANLVWTGAHDFGGATSLELPNSATPTVSVDGQIALDTTVADFSHGILKYYGGEEMAVVAMPIAQLTTPTDGYVVAYNATNDEFELVAGGTGGGAYSDAADPVILNTTTKDVIIAGAAQINTAKASIDGDDDQVQFAIQGHSTQTANIVEIENSGGTIIVSVNASGLIDTSGGINTDSDITFTTPAALEDTNQITFKDRVGVTSPAVDEGRLWIDNTNQELQFSNATNDYGVITSGLVKNSIVVDTRSLQLSGDSASPGNNKVYGTNGSGVKGWKDDPAGSGGTDWNARNETGSTITKGTPVYPISYDSGDTKMLIGPADGSDATKAEVMGLAKADITTATNGDVVTLGELSGLNTSAWAEGDILYADGGVLTNLRPPYPRKTAIVLYSHASSGIVYVLPSMPVFQLGQGTGSMVHIVGGSLASADSEVVMDYMDFDYYDYFKIVLRGWSPTVDGADLDFSLRSGGSDMAVNHSSRHAIATSGSVAETNDGPTSGGCALIPGLGTTTNEGLGMASIEFHREAAGVFDQSFLIYYGCKKNISAVAQSFTGGAHVNTAGTQPDGIRLYMSSGNIESEAAWDIWGIRAS
jgi:hypothetical protein